MNPKLKHFVRLLIRSAILWMLATGAACIFTRTLGLSCGIDALLLMGLLILHPVTVVLGTEYRESDG